MRELDIIIPVFNERENIVGVLEGLRRDVKTPFRVLICYDEDDDNTLPAVRGWRDAPFEIVLVKNKGSGVLGAVRSGFAASDAPAVIVFPADDVFNVGIIDAMYRKFEEGCDIVAASRFMRGGCMKGCPFPKAFFVRAASFTLHWLAGVPVHDASSGFRLFSRRVIDRLWIESREGFTYSIELLVKCRRLGWKIGEVPALWFERTRGRSRFRVWRWLPHYLVWYRYAFATAYLRRPPSTVRLRGMERSSAQDKDAEKKFFDQFGGERPYDVFTDGGYARITDEFLKHFDPKPGLVVADLGCGTGAFTAKFAGFGLRLFGVDISPQCIASARRQHPGITFEVGDIEKTHYSNETFDAIFLSGVLHHLKDLAGVFRECHRILKRDGVLLGYDPHRRNPFMSAFRCKHSPLYIARGLTENERPLSREEILGALARSGFTRVSVYSISGVTYKYIDSDWSFISLPVYNCIERIFDLFGPIRSRFGSFLITCARKGAA